MSKSTGIFHQLKKLIAHTSKTPDPQYDTAYENFTKLNNTVYRVKQNLHSYTQAMQQLFNSSNAISIDLGSLIEEKTDQTAANQARYNELVGEMRDKHHELIGEKAHNLSSQAANEILKKLDEEIDTYKGIQSRINQREELHGELDYYSKKVEKLQQEKDKRILSDSGDSAKANEKLLRNQQKLADQQVKFAPYNQELIRDMEKVWSNRKLILGPALNCFAKLEKDLGENYYNSMKEIRLVADIQVEQDLKEQNQQKQTIIRNNSFHAEQQQHKQHVSTSTTSTATNSATTTANTSREPSPARQLATNQPHFVQNTAPGKFNSQVANSSGVQQADVMITPATAPSAPEGDLPYVENTNPHINPLSAGLPNKTDSTTLPNPFAHSSNTTTTTTSVAELSSEADKTVAYLNQQTTNKQDNTSMPAPAAESHQELAARNSVVFRLG